MRDYGNRVAVVRMKKVLDRYDVRATICLNSDVSNYQPRIIEEGSTGSLEWIDNNTDPVQPTQFTSDKQRALVHECLATIEQHTGERPKGWLGPGLRENWDTLEILADAGIEYVCDWCNDDQPLTMTLESGKTLVA